jgi:hypothetical protein
MSTAKSRFRWRKGCSTRHISENASRCGWNRQKECGGTGKDTEYPRHALLCRTTMRVSYKITTRCRPTMTIFFWTTPSCRTSPIIWCQGATQSRLQTRYHDVFERVTTSVSGLLAFFGSTTEQATIQMARSLSFLSKPARHPSRPAAEASVQLSHDCWGISKRPRISCWSKVARGVYINHIEENTYDSLTLFCPGIDHLHRAALWMELQASKRSHEEQDASKCF